MRRFKFIFWEYPHEGASIHEDISEWKQWSWYSQRRNVTLIMHGVTTSAFQCKICWYICHEISSVLRCDLMMGCAVTLRSTHEIEYRLILRDYRFSLSGLYNINFIWNMTPCSQTVILLQSFRRICSLHSIQVSLLYPGRECIVDVALWRGRNSNLGQGSEFKVPCSSNNWSWEVYCILVSELQQGDNSEDSDVPLVSA